MNKKLHFKSLLLLAAMLFGVSSAWADEVTSTMTFEAACGGSGTADDGVKWTITSDGAESAFDNTKGIHYGTGKAAVKYIKLSTLDITGTISKIVVNASTASGVNATADVTVGGNAFGGDAQTLTATATDYSFTGSASGEIVVTVTKPESAVKALYVKSIAVTYTSSGTVTTLTDTEVTINNISEKINVGQTLELTATVKDDESQVIPSATVTWESTNEDVATIENGVISALKGGQTTITASYAGQEGTYKGSSASFTLTVAGAIEDGVFDFSIGQDYGSNLAQSAVTVQTSTWTAGNVTMVASGRNCWFTDNKTFRVYKNNAKEGEEDNAGTLTFSVSEEGKVITKIVFTGDLLGDLAAAEGSYSDNTWEGSSKTVTLSAKADAGTIKIETITVTYDNPPSVVAPESSVQTGTYYEPQSVELTCATEGADIYYTIDGTDPTEESTKYSGAIEVSETTTIKAIAATSDAVSAIMEVKITIPAPITITMNKEMETFCSATAVDLGTSGLSAFIAKVEDGSVVLYSVESGEIPANRGVILIGEAGKTYNVKAIEKAEKLDETNELYGLANGGKVSYFYNNTYNYILQDGKFKKATGDKLKGGKAYLKTTYDVEKAGAREMKIVFAGEATAIKAIEMANDQNVYDLQGRKVAAPQKGLYIINGKKMIVK